MLYLTTSVGGSGWKDRGGSGSRRMGRGGDGSGRMGRGLTTCCTSPNAGKGTRDVGAERLKRECGRPVHVSSLGNAAGLISRG